MEQLKTALFDFDGVIADTEPIYDAYWDEAATRYGVGIERFSQLIKGTTMRYILDKYFADRTEAFKRMVAEESDAFERTMPFPPLPGALEFLRALRERGTRTGLVTSSEEEKVRRILTVMPLEGMFDTIVHAGRVKRGKPAPDCYLLAASDLGVCPADCLVFEDSLNGIQAIRRHPRLQGKDVRRFPALASLRKPSGRPENPAETSEKPSGRPETFPGPSDRPARRDKTFPEPSESQRGATKPSPRPRTDQRGATKPSQRPRTVQRGKTKAPPRARRGQRGATTLLSIKTYIPRARR